MSVIRYKLDATSNTADNIAYYPHPNTYHWSSLECLWIKTGWAHTNDLDSHKLVHLWLHSFWA